MNVIKRRILSSAQDVENQLVFKNSTNMWMRNFVTQLNLLKKQIDVLFVMKISVQEKKDLRNICL